MRFLDHITDSYIYSLSFLNYSFTKRLYFKNNQLQNKLNKCYYFSVNRGWLYYDKYFKNGDIKRNLLSEFNSNNTRLLHVKEVKEKLMKLDYIKDELAKWEARQ